MTNPQDKPAVERAIHFAINTFTLCLRNNRINAERYPLTIQEIHLSIEFLEQALRAEPASDTPGDEMDESPAVTWELGRQEVEREFRKKNLQERVAYVLDMFNPEAVKAEIDKQAALTPQPSQNADAPCDGGKAFLSDDNSGVQIPCPECVDVFNGRRDIKKSLNCPRCSAKLTSLAQPSQNAGDVEVEKDGWDRAAKLKADIFYFREAYKNEWEDFDLQRFDRMEKCVDYLTKGKTND